MDWIDCPESSTIAKFSYNSESQTLDVEFKSGNLYRYFDIPAVIFEEMKAATSRGRFLSASIKGIYRYARL